MHGTCHDTHSKQAQIVPFTTLWLRPCLSRNEIIDSMCPSLMTFSASGLSTSTQCRTSKTPVNANYPRLLYGGFMVLTSKFCFDASLWHENWFQNQMFKMRLNIWNISIHNNLGKMQEKLLKIYIVAWVFQLLLYALYSVHTRGGLESV